MPDYDSLDLSVSESFPCKTHRMIEHCHEHEPESLCFQKGESGELNVIAIKNKNRFEVYLDKFRVVQPKDRGGKASYESFRRQLGNYGFVRANEGRKVILWHHRDNLFRKGDVAALKDIKISKSNKRGDNPVSEITELKDGQVFMETKLQKVEKQMQDPKEVMKAGQVAMETQLQNVIVSECRELKAELVAVKTHLHKVEKQMQDNQKELMGMLNLLAENRTGTGVLHNIPAALRLKNNGATKRLREDDSTSESGSSSTSQVPHSVTDASNTTFTSTATQKSVSQNGNASTEGSGPLTPSQSATKSSQGMQEAGVQPQNLDSISIGDGDRAFNELMKEGDLAFQRWMKECDGDTASSSKPQAETIKSIPPCQVLKRRKTHERQTSSSSHASTISSLSSDGAFSSTSTTRPRLRLSLVTKRDKDVLCGNEDFSSHPGNGRHTLLVTELRLSYAQATKGVKNNICAAIVAIIKKEGGLFLERTPACGAGHPGRACWLELSDERAKVFTACALEGGMRREHSGNISGSKDNGGQGNGGQGNNGKGSEPGNEEGSKDANSKGDDSAQGGLDGSGGSASGVFDYSSGGSGAVWATSVPINVPSTDVSVKQENVIKEEELSGTEDISDSNGLPADPTLSKLTTSKEKSLPLGSDRHVPDVLKEEHSREGKLSVSFSQLSVRNYPMILGDHPVCSNGPPVTIGWRFHAESPVDVDEYESIRPERQKPWDLIMPPEKRRTILINEAGHTEWEIREATRGVKEVKKQRQKSARGICIQEAIEATERTFRGLRINNKNRRKSSSKKHLQKDGVASSAPLGFEHRDSVAMLQSRAAGKE